MTYEREVTPEVVERWTTRVIRIQHTYENPVDQQHAQGLLYGVLFSAGIYLIGLFLFFIPAAFGIEGATTSDLVAAFVPPVLIVLVFYWIQTGLLRRASVLAVLGSIPFSISMVQANGVESPSLILMVVPLVLTALLLDRRWLSMVVSILALSLMLVVFSEDGSLGILFESTVFEPLVVVVLLIAIIFALSGHEREIVDENLRITENMNKALDFMLRQDLDVEHKIFTEAIQLLRNELGYDFAQVFVTDSQGAVRSRLRTGLSAGRGEEEVAIRMNVTHGPVNAILSRKMVTITLDDVASRRSHFLASTQYSYLIPIIYQNEAFAVIDVHSMNAPLTDTDFDVFDHLAQNIAMRIHGMRDRHSLATRLEEFQAANDYLNEQLRTSRRSSNDLIGTSWEEYLSGRGSDAVGFNLADDIEGMVHVGDLPEHIQSAMRAKEVIVQDVKGLPTLIVPVILQDEVLGAMAFSLPKGQNVTQSQLDIARNIARRLALALENRRLFEQTQAQALRERTASDMAQQLITATDIESVLSLAANRFHEALGAVHTQIRLQPETASTKQSENGTAS